MPDNNLANVLSTRGGRRRPRRCSGKPWRSLSRHQAQVTLIPPPPTAIWPWSCTQGRPGSGRGPPPAGEAIRLNALGAGHPRTAESYNNIAETLIDQGKLTEAEALHRRALAVWPQVLGEAHPVTVESYANLAYVL